jgi:DNA-binding transcriptional LysR family regulator
MFHFANIPNLRHLRMAQVIGKTGGVSCASRELSTSQPAVTQAVANLEAEIKSPIFERTATGTYPTAMGQKYLKRIDRFFEILDKAIEHVLSRDSYRADLKTPRADWLMTNTQMRSLIVTSEQGRVNEIAEIIGLFPASLFRSARTLERSLGLPLFERTARGVFPTKTGEYLAREFRRAAREIEMAHGEALLAEGVESLEITVGALPMAGSNDLAKATRMFQSQFPNVKVRLMSGEYHKLVADLSNSAIDMIFGILRKPEWATDLQEEMLFHDSYCLVANPQHPLTRLPEVRAEDLIDCEWIVPQAKTPRRNRIEEIFDGFDRRPKFHLETPSLAMSRAFLIDHETVTLMARSEVQSDLDLGVLVSLPCTFLDNVLFKGVTTREDWLPTQAHNAFLDCLRQVCSGLNHGTVFSERRAANGG